MQNLTSANLVIFDLETTSVDTEQAEILELAALYGERQFHRYLETKSKVSEDLFAFQHINFAEYQAKKIPANQALQEFLEFVETAPLCGHNIYAYDLPVLRHALKAATLSEPKGVQTAIDTLRWAHLRFPTPPDELLGYSVGALLTFMTGQKLEDAHLALEDCKATKTILEQLILRPPEALQLRLWQYLDLPEAHFFKTVAFEAEELPNLMLIPAVVPHLNTVGQVLPSAEELFPAWIQSGLQRRVFTTEMLNQAFLDIGNDRNPIGFSPAEISSLKIVVQLLPKYRAPQGKMAHLVRAALEGQYARVMVQAPTGTGKTKGYIFPALHHQATARNETIIIATHTKVLQQQAMRELEDLSKKGFTVRASNLKSARDSVCNEALEESLREYNSAEDDVFRKAGAARAVLVGLIRQHDFDLEALPFFWQAMPEFREVRFNVQTISSRCRSSCPFYKHCAYQTDLRQRADSNLWITNQAYLLSKLAQSTDSTEESAAGSFHLIIDEAHNLEDVATNSFTKISRSEDVIFHLRKLFDKRRNKGVLATNRLTDGSIQLNHPKLIEALGTTTTTVRDLATHIRQRLIPECETRFEEYNQKMIEFLKQFARGDIKYSITYTLKGTKTPEWMRLIRFERFWREAMIELRAALLELFHQAPNMKYKLEPTLDFLKQHNQMLQERLDATHSENKQNQEPTAEIEPNDDWLYLSTLHTDNTWEHVAQPIDLEPFLKPLWERAKSVSLTSATLLPGAKNEFEYFRNVLHLGDIETRRLAETLPYDKAHIILPSHLPETRPSSLEKFMRLHQEELKNLLPQINRSLNLFTSRDRMKKTKVVLEQEADIVSRLHAPMTRRERESVSQTLSNAAYRDKKAIALGTRAFMEGVDFFDLNFVGLEKIPFPTPTPLLERRQMLIKQIHGDEAAWEYYLGKAILTFTQAFGRLIRDDRVQSGNGAFVLWDKRLLTSTYYNHVLEALPQKFHQGDQVYFPKNRLAFYQYLKEILGIDLTGFEDTLQDPISKLFTELRRKWRAGEIMLEEALRQLNELFWDSNRAPKEKQLEAIQAALDKKDALVLLPTGYGKSFTFQAPAFLEDGLTIVISPLIALMKDQVEGLLARGAPINAIYAGMPSAEQRSIIQQAENGEINLLYLSPERVNKNNDLEQMIRQLAARGKLKRLVFDEAHCLSDWGHDFRPDYLRVKSKLEDLGLKNLSVACLTATATDKVQKSLIDKLDLKNPLEIRASNDRPNIQYFAERFSGERDDRSKLRSTIQIIEWANQHYQDDYAIIIYVSTRKKAETVARALSTYLGQKIEAYHGGLSPILRRETQEHFMDGTNKVIVATNAFGMGVDKTNVRVVIHFQPPSNVPAYIQEAGRAGRDGKAAYALLMHSSRDWSLHEYIGALGQPQRHHAEALLEVLKKNTGTVRLYNDTISTQINDALADKEDLADLEKEGVLWLLNTMQQSDLLEYSYELGKARVIIGNWAVMQDLGAENLRYLEKLEVSPKSTARQHWLDFTKLPLEEANALADALHALRRTLDNPVLLFATFEASIEIKLGKQQDILEFQKIVQERFEQRKAGILEMKNYANSSACKRDALLRVFSERVDTKRNPETCCGNCNNETKPWSDTPRITDEEIVQILKPNRAILEFLRDHRKERLSWIERKRKDDASFILEYSGIGTRRISMVLRGVESEFVGGDAPLQLKWYESNSRHFGNLIGATHDEIAKTTNLLAARNLITQTEYQQGSTYKISEKGLSELEKTRGQNK